jgi:exopolysaccharide production protein ExoZ
MKKLESIEAGRAVAALSVVFFHANAGVGHVFGDAYMTSLFVWGDRGVDFFFVLSGFIIGHVHRDDIGRGERFRDYALKRIIRIYPVLWIVAGGWMILKYVFGGETSSPEAIGTSLFLYPSLERPEPLVIWTLRHEILFYLMFALLIASRRIGTFISLAWLGGCLLQLCLLALGRGFEGVAAMVLSAFQLQFALGMLAAWAHRRYVPARPHFLLGSALALVGVVVIVSTKVGAGRFDTLDYVSSGATVWVLIFGVSLAFLVYALAASERILRVPRWLVFLGAASYAIYLVHTPAISVFQRVISPILPGAAVSTGVAHVVLILAGVAAGCLLHVLFEKPATRALRNRLSVNPPRHAPRAVD